MASLVLGYDDFILPISKKYSTNNIDVSHDTEISFFMPKNKIRYEATSNINKIFDVTNQSNDFQGSFELTANQGEEKNYKLKFGAFDENDNLIKESNYYYLKIDKKLPDNDVETQGIDFNYVQNEMQTLKLLTKDKDAKIYYRFDKTKEWILYTEQIIFYPPLFGESKIDIYCMSKDKMGNVRYNQEPFTLKFDRRGIFVDATKKFSGNGTFEFPYNSLERAIYFAKEKNIKLIYLVSNDVNHFLPLQIESDIIIQPYNIENFSTINMETRSLWKKNHVWFDLLKNGYLEIRNINFNLKSGNVFVNVNNNKFKLYNSNIIYLGKENFSVFSSIGGKIGINNISL
ncbi:MAG TPA: hypothetical protein PK771_16185, partial [Spirochaetota bacterium]|nr:hypothetical protein [Spirochaetota bacterium]